MNIVYVEEDVFFAEGVKRAFSQEGIDVFHVTKVEQLDELLEKEPPHAVLLELRLSTLNGFEALKLFKSQRRFQNIPILVWSYLASREDVERCLGLGAAGYFLKTQHTPREVARHVKSAMNLKPAFTLPEWLIVIACLLFAFGFLGWQLNRVLDMRRDDGQLAAVRAYVSTLVTAAQERQLLLGCKEGEMLRGCRICRDEACRNSSPVPWQGEPSYERRAFVGFLDPESVCTASASRPCHVTIERDGEQPISPEAFKLRFFLSRSREGLAGGQTHTINAHGLIE